MEHYGQIVWRYLKKDRKRGRITIFGTIMVVSVLFAILNLGICKVLQIRENIRQEQNYEVVFLTENREQIQTISQDKRIKDAYVGSYYAYDYNESKIYPEALYVNFQNPYHMDKVAEELGESVGFSYNSELATTYLQGGDDYLGVGVFSFVILGCFVFAIFGVGIVRNSISLSMLEQIKDYGNMRCVGATRHQLKKIIYMQGLYLETIGLIIGSVGGIGLSVIFGKLLEIPVGVHFLPVLPIGITFYGDLYFAMQESCKMITGMSPVEAIRGEYRIKKEKIKVRHSGLFGILFGVEGDYAYKNALRNPKRFWKTTGAIALGVAAYISLMGMIEPINRYMEENLKLFGYYQEYFDAAYLMPTQTVDEARSNLENLAFEKLSSMEEVSKATQVYQSVAYMKNESEFSEHFTQEYKDAISYGQYLHAREVIAQGSDSLARKYGMYLYSARMNAKAYDEEDIKRYQDVLVDGTLDVDENGIILINGGKVPVGTDLEINFEFRDVTYTDYQVGDSIEIMDMKRFRELFQEQIQPVKEKYAIKKTMDWELDQVSDSGNFVSLDSGKEGETAYSDEQEALESEYNEEYAKVIFACLKQIEEEHAYKTYIIEGIVSEDVNRYNGYNEHGLDFIMPYDTYFDLTGTTKDMSVGMQYHFDHFPSLKYINTIGAFEPYGVWNVFGECEVAQCSGYSLFVMELLSMKGVMIGVACFILFIVAISCLNIMNTTASNVHLRGKEFAQLRVIGVSRKGLVKMVLLEGFVSAVFANIIGGILGVGISYYVVKLIFGVLFGSSYNLPGLSILVAFVVSVLVLCGSGYGATRGLTEHLVDELKTAE